MWSFLYLLHEQTDSCEFCNNNPKETTLSFSHNDEKNVLWHTRLTTTNTFSHHCRTSTIWHFNPVTVAATNWLCSLNKKKIVSIARYPFHCPFNINHGNIFLVHSLWKDTWFTLFSPPTPIPECISHASRGAEIPRLFK